MLKIAYRVTIALIIALVVKGCATDPSEFDSLSEDGRCEAITQKGTRCKRRAQSGSHYCWQHQSLEATYTDPNDSSIIATSYDDEWSEDK